MEFQLIEQENGVVLKDSSVKDSKNGGGGGGGATWAFEVAGQTLVCPIIVEDMDPPGRMLIEVRKRECIGLRFFFSVFTCYFYFMFPFVNEIMKTGIRIF